MIRHICKADLRLFILKWNSYCLIEQSPASGISRDSLPCGARKSINANHQQRRDQPFNRIHSAPKPAPLLHQKKIVVVLPAYNAEKTLEKTISDIPEGVVDELILVDDYSTDNTSDLAMRLGLTCIRHEANKGYGGNQKTCYQAALDAGADVIIMLHPDYQYDPRLITAMAAMVTSGTYDVVLGSRILGTGALKGGMPLYKYVANRFLTLVQNLLIGQKLSEYHTGYRAFSREVLSDKRWMRNSDDFIFDNQIIVQLHHAGARFGEVSVPTRYFEEASSINFSRSVRYGIGVLWVSGRFFLNRLRLLRYGLLEK